MVNDSTYPRNHGSRGLVRARICAVAGKRLGLFLDASSGEDHRSDFFDHQCLRERRDSNAMAGRTSRDGARHPAQWANNLIDLGRGLESGAGRDADVARILTLFSGSSSLSMTSPRHLVAPVIARPSGARRAGQDRAAPKGSLDAPKRSRTIEHRSDARPWPSRHRLTPKRGSRQLDRARAVQRKDWGLREEPHQLLWRLGFGPSSVPRLSHECEVVQGAKQATVPGPAERQLRHPHRAHRRCPRRRRRRWPASRTRRPETPCPAASLRGSELRPEVETVR